MTRHSGSRPFRAIAIAVGLFCALSVPAGATDLRYTPLNPAFGGSPLLDDYLLGTANAQNQFLNNGSGGGGGGAAAPVIVFPPIDIDFGGVAPTQPADDAGAAFVPQVAE